MKRLVIALTGVVVLGIAALWAVAQLQASRSLTLPSMMPDGALLYLEAKDFGMLIKDWNQSAERRTWLSGDNYAGFSNSRLFARLSQAGDEFSAAAGLPVDNGFLSSVAGTQSGLGLYDIGNLEFVYVTRMGQHVAENTPLWQVRAKFEQRVEGASTFFVHRDPQSNRTAAFAIKDGWLILGTKEELVAGVLDRMQSPAAKGLADEPWYANLIKEADAPQGDLRMALNLDRIVPSPYFRTYWVQRNITEMKQYTSALCDLFRTSETYRDERVLVRRANLPAIALGDVHALVQWVPDDSVFYSAQASADAASVLSSLRENIVDRQSVPIAADSYAPPPAQFELAGSASMLEETIDQAPAHVTQADAYAPLRSLLQEAQPTAALQLYVTRAPRENMFVGIDSAMVVEAAQSWDEEAARVSLSAALHPGLTVAQAGLGWVQRTSPGGNYSALDGQVPLYLAIRGKSLLIATREVLLQAMFAHRQSAPSVAATSVTYEAVFHHSTAEIQNYHSLASRLDRAGRASSDGAQDEQGHPPAFFSGNIESLSRMFSSVDRQSIQVSDQGSKVIQTVVYHFQHHDASTGQ
jgi:hypothetical protein